MTLSKSETEDLVQMKMDIQKLFIVIDNISDDIDEIESDHCEFAARIKEIENIQTQKAAFFKLLSDHWWKVLMILAPIMGFLIEVGVYLRNLPPPKP